MAKFLRLLGQEREIVQEKFFRHREAESSQALEYNSAVRIQSWFRGLRVRHYIRHLQKCAIIVQRHWRGFMGRRFYRISIRNSVMIMRMNFYSCMATRIQKVWRGFYVREHVHNFYARKRYMEALVIKNQIVRHEIDEYQEQLDSARKRREHEELERKLHYQARKHHYLLSTHQKPGVYNSPYWPYPDDMEYRLRAAKPLDHSSRKLNNSKLKTTISMDMVDSKITTIKPRPPVEPLPPIQRQKPQGPFRDPAIVYAQRYKKLHPSLRVSTDFNSLDTARQEMRDDEWEKRVIDAPFLPFTQSRSQYEPLLHSTSDYGHPPYGTVYFRETNPEQDISSKRLQTVVSPIPIFEKFKQTYSKGAVVLQ